MRQQGHKRSRTTNKTIAIVAALVIGGGGAAAIAASASAGSDEDPALAASTIDCPDVSLALGDVPKEAKEPVGRKLAALDQQVASAYGQWRSKEAESEEALNKLSEQRTETIRGIGQELQKAGAEQPSEMQGMAECQMKQGGGAQPQEGEEGGGEEGQQPTGPVAEDFVDITTVEPNAPEEKEEPEAGSFTTECGVNEEEHFNADNVIAAPGVKAGAHHIHDYVGNLDTDFESSDESLAAADTTCAQGDQSTHYWPVIRQLDGVEDEKQLGAGADASPQGAPYGDNQGQDAGQDEGQDQGQDAGQDQGQDQGQDAGQDQGQDQGQDAGQDQGQDQGQDAGQDQGQDGGEDGGGEEEEPELGDGGASDGNIGTVLQPASAELKFTKGQADEVVAMPRFLRIITGDAKSFTNGTENANASWSCEGFEDRQLEDKYPICPEGSQMIRTFKFQSCWDGQNTDSGNHRDHVAFAEEDGSCPDGFQAIPALEQRIKYELPNQNLLNEATPFAVDSFPEQLHKPVTDHSDFINVMPDDLMNETVSCINEGRDC